MGRMGFRCFLILLGCLFLAALPSPALLAQADTVGPYDLGGESIGPCTVDIELANKVLPRPLPFDVPVFLTGTLAEEGWQSRVQRLNLHVFQARHPLRVALTCANGGELPDCLEDEQELVCHRQGIEEDIDDLIPTPPPFSASCNISPLATPVSKTPSLDEVLRTCGQRVAVARAPTERRPCSGGSP